MEVCTCRWGAVVALVVILVVSVWLSYWTSHLPVTATEPSLLPAGNRDFIGRSAALFPATLDLYALNGTAATMFRTYQTLLDNATMLTALPIPLSPRLQAMDGYVREQQASLATCVIPGKLNAALQPNHLQCSPCASVW